MGHFWTFAADTTFRGCLKAWVPANRLNLKISRCARNDKDVSCVIPKRSEGSL